MYSVCRVARSFLVRLIRRRRACAQLREDSAHVRRVCVYYVPCTDRPPSATGKVAEGREIGSGTSSPICINFATFSSLAAGHGTAIHLDASRRDAAPKEGYTWFGQDLLDMNNSLYAFFCTAIIIKHFLRWRKQGMPHAEGSSM